LGFEDNQNPSYIFSEIREWIEILDEQKNQIREWIEILDEKRNHGGGMLSAMN